MSRQTNFSRKLVLNSPDRKPSVFERLGTKSGVASTKNVCRNWAQNGTCPLNKQCKLAQTHLLISPSKRSKSEAMKKSVVAHKKCKDEHKKSLRSHHSSELEWEGWELGDLEDADEKVLEKRKQELQRELQLQLKKEKELTRKKEKRNEKKRAASSSSSSSSTTESSSSTTSSSSSSSEPRKRPSRKRKHSSSSSESERSLHRQKKTPKTVKTKLTALRKPLEKKDIRTMSDVKNKSVIIAKKTTVQKKSYSPNWNKSRGRSPVKQQISKKSPHHSPDIAKNKSSSPRYDKIAMKNKNRGYSPKSKAKESSPKRATRKVKEPSVHGKDKPRQSPAKLQTSPSRTRKVSPSRSRRHEESSEKRRGHYEDQKHSPRRDRSREKDRKKDIRRGRSNDNDSNGGLKKGGKILPLKPPSYNKDNGVKKESTHHKPSDKNSTDLKSKEENIEKERSRVDREKDRSEKEKAKCERDKSKHKKGNEEHERRSVRDRDSEKNTIRNRDERGRGDREAERLRFTKEKELIRQKERDEALERCRERQRERERLEKERKEKDDKKHQREPPENKTKDFDRELPSLLDLKAENPARNIGDTNNIKSAEKHLTRDSRRNLDSGIDKPINQDRDARDRGTPGKDHDRRDSRRSDENDRRQVDKGYDGRRDREGEVRNSSEMRRSLGDGRRVTDDASDSRRPWEEARRQVDTVHDRRRTLETSNNDRRQHSLGRRPVEDPYRRGRGEGDTDRDFSVDDRRGRKLMHNCSDWDVKDQNLDYRDSEGRDDWNLSDRHRDWNSRYDHKWIDREESRDSNWAHYSRRTGHEDWNGDWSQEQSRQIYSEEERRDLVSDGFADQSGKRHNEIEPVRPLETNKEKEINQEEVSSSIQRENPARDGDALSDISDDPDDILNQDDYPNEENIPDSSVRNSNQQIYIRSNEFLFDQRRPLLECLGERSLDFEEISDEELEEEARANKGIVDVLGADWAGLLQETRPKPKRSENSGSAHGRWTIEKLISTLGISVKYASQEFCHQLVEECDDFKEKEFSEKQNSLCSEKKKANEENEEQATEKDKENENNAVFNLPTTTPVKAEHNISGDIKIKGFFHSIPALHSAMKEAQCTKSVLFVSHNRFKRALSARTDLSLRRELCNLPSKEPLHFTPPLDNRMYEASIQQFQSGTTMAVV